MTQDGRQQQCKKAKMKITCLFKVCVSNGLLLGFGPLGLLRQLQKSQEPWLSKRQSRGTNNLSKTMSNLWFCCYPKMALKGPPTSHQSPPTWASAKIIHADKGHRHADLVLAVLTSFCKASMYSLVFADLVLSGLISFRKAFEQFSTTLTSF